MSSYPSRWRDIEKKRKAGKKFLRDPSRETFMELAENLWATHARSNMEYYMDEMVFSEKTPKEVANIIKRVLEGKESVKEILNIRGMGWQTATEILHTLRPEEFSIFGKRSIEGIEKLVDNYDPPSPQSASVSQYEEFTQKVKEAVEKYDLREKLKNRVNDWDNEDLDKARDLEIADAAFNADNNGDIDLLKIKKKVDKADILDFFPEGIRDEIKKVVKQDSLYADEKDFIVSAVRQTIKKERDKK